MKKILWAGGLSFMLSGNVAAAPLSACPTEAFLMQGSPAKLFSVDLSTGAYQSLETDTGAPSVLNAVAFSTHDNYLYGWNKSAQTLFRMGDDYQVENLTLQNPLDGHYYVGDVSVAENAYYMYRKGNNALHGLWRVELDSASQNYLQAVRIVNGSATRLNIYDFAFHPVNNEIYSVDSSGELIRIDPSDGSYEELGNMGISGTFGAVYFDVNGNLYVSKNKGGKIFKIDLNVSSPTAVLFAQGPASSSNDGARCAVAEVTTSNSSLVDFGDAPDSYGTTLAANGARHNVASNTSYLGSSFDGEAQAYLHPLSDDTVDSDDEDGVVLISNITAGTQAILQVTNTGGGFLNGWIDFNGNGQFDGAEKIFNDEVVVEGTSTKIVDIPLSAQPGDTWARFRISTVAGALPTGGMPDGEVEDYPIQIAAANITKQFYPSDSSFVTLAFEDLWPSVGDYDLNDFVTNYRTGITTNNGQVIALHISGQITAMGATFHNGFAVQVDGLPRGNVDEANIVFQINGEMQNHSPLEAGHTNAVFVVANDLWDYVTPAEGCTFYRTESDCGESPVQFSYSLEIPLTTNVAEANLPLSLFKPFLIATNGFNRNSIFSSPPGRDLEIHLKNNSPSELADPELLGRADDRSLPNADLYYQTATGLPWAIEIGTEWIHPKEYVDLINAYPDFIDYVTSGGTTNTDWYLLENAVTNELYFD